MKVLIDYHLYAHEENKRADILCEKMLNGGLFDSSATKDVAMKVLWSVTSMYYFNISTQLNNKPVRMTWHVDSMPK